MKTGLSLVGVCAVLALSSFAAATPMLIDIGGNQYRIKWPEGTASSPTQIDVYVTPGTLSTEDVAALSTGIESWDNILPGISVDVHVGAPPPSAPSPVTVSFQQDLFETKGDYGFGGPVPPATPPPGTTSYAEGGEILIDSDAAGHGNFLENLGKHEFGHVLGLDDDPGTLGVMDPDLGPQAPIRSFTEYDYAEIRLLYNIDPPEPSTLVLFGGGVIAGLMRRRRTR